MPWHFKCMSHTVLCSIPGNIEFTSDHQNTKTDVCCFAHQCSCLVAIASRFITVSFPSFSLPFQACKCDTILSQNGYNHLCLQYIVSGPQCILSPGTIFQAKILPPLKAHIGPSIIFSQIYWLFHSFSLHTSSRTSSCIDILKVAPWNYMASVLWKPTVAYTSRKQGQLHTWQWSCSQWYIPISESCGAPKM